MNGQAERHLSTVVDMTRALLNTSELLGKYWPLAVYHATFLKSRLPCTALGDRSPYSLVFGYSTDLSHLCIVGLQVQAFLPPQEREGKLADRARADRYVRRTDSCTTCVLLDEKTNRLFR